jgi:hypothetical protein
MKRTRKHFSYPTSTGNDRAEFDGKINCVMIEYKNAALNQIQVLGKLLIHRCIRAIQILLLSKVTKI